MLSPSLQVTNSGAAPLTGGAGYATNTAHYLKGAEDKQQEFLAHSSLDGCQWPTTDPTSFPQKTRARNPEDAISLRKAATALPFDAERFLKENRHLDLTGRVHAFLTCGKFQFNSVADVRSETIWQNRVRDAVCSGRPIEIVYPLFSKVMVWSKQMDNSSATAGEEAALHFFRYFNRCLQQVYPPGARINVLVDATLYNSAIQNPEPTVRRYFRDLCALSAEAGLEGVYLYDYAELLAESAPRYRSAYLSARRQMIPGAENAEELGTWLESLRSGLNTLRFPLTFSDQLEIFGPVKNPRNRWYALIDTLAREALREMIAIKAACNEVNLPEQLWPGHLRVTCHRGRKLGHALPGLRVYPRFFNGCRTLPYHGVPLLLRRKDSIILEIHPEIILRGRSDLTRVLDQHGETSFYEVATCN